MYFQTNKKFKMSEMNNEKIQYHNAKIQKYFTVRTKRKRKFFVNTKFMQR